MTVTFRTFTDADIPAARALWQALPGIGLSSADEPGALAAYLRRNPGTSFVARAADDALAGTVLCGHDGRRGLVHHLATAAPFQRRGIARRLLAEALAALRREGIAKCHLMVFRANADGLAFWRSAGAEERANLVLYSIGTQASPDAHFTGEAR